MNKSQLKEKSFYSQITRLIKNMLEYSNRTFLEVKSKLKENSNHA
jgi:hypothetical protein